MPIVPAQLGKGVNFFSLRVSSRLEAFAALILNVLYLNMSIKMRPAACDWLCVVTLDASIYSNISFCLPLFTA